MSKPKFDPSKPFEVVGASAAPAAAKPKFDPSKPFEPVTDKSSTAMKIIRPVMEGGGAAVGTLVGAAAGGAGAPVGGALGYAAGKVGADLLERGMGDKPPIETPGQAVTETADALGAGMMAESGAKIIGSAVGPVFRGLYKIGEKSGGIATSLMRRALGYRGGMLTEKGEIERANSVAKTMLDSVVEDPATGAQVPMLSASGKIGRFFKLSAGTETLKQRAEILSKAAGKKIEGILAKLDDAGIRTVDNEALANQVEQRLRPSYPREGAYAEKHRIVDEIISTIRSHRTRTAPSNLSPMVSSVPEAMTFGSGQDLKLTLKEFANFNKVTDKAKAHYYRDAYGIVREMIDDSVGKAEEVLGPKGTGILKEYLDAKGIYGKSEEALLALSDKLGKELGNNLIGLRETIVAANQLNAALTAGSPAGAAAAAATAASKPITQNINALGAKVAKNFATFLKRTPPSQRQAMIEIATKAGLFSEARKFYGEFAKRGINLPRENKK